MVLELRELLPLGGVIAMAVVPQRGVAQRPELPRLFETYQVALDSTVSQPTHWAEGAIIGGVAVGVLGAMMAEGLCSDNPNVKCAIGGAVVGGVIGVVVGGLIGGLFPKSSEDLSP